MMLESVGANYYRNCMNVSTYSNTSNTHPSTSLPPAQPAAAAAAASTTTTTTTPHSPTSRRMLVNTTTAGAEHDPSKRKPKNGTANHSQAALPIGVRGGAVGAVRPHLNHATDTSHWSYTTPRTKRCGRVDGPSPQQQHQGEVNAEHAEEELCHRVGNDGEEEQRQTTTLMSGMTPEEEVEVLLAADAHRIPTEVPSTSTTAAMTSNVASGGGVPLPSISNSSPLTSSQAAPPAGEPSHRPAGHHHHHHPHPSSSTSSPRKGVVRDVASPTAPQIRIPNDSSSGHDTDPLQQTPLGSYPSVGSRGRGPSSGISMPWLVHVAVQSFQGEKWAVTVEEGNEQGGGGLATSCRHNHSNNTPEAADFSALHSTAPLGASGSTLSSPNAPLRDRKLLGIFSGSSGSQSDSEASGSLGYQLPSQRFALVNNPEHLDDLDSLSSSLLNGGSTSQQCELTELSQTVKELNEVSSASQSSHHSRVKLRASMVEFSLSSPSQSSSPPPTSGDEAASHPPAPHYYLTRSIHPLISSVAVPAVDSVLDDGHSAMILVFGATLEMKQLGVIGSPSDCGLFPHSISLMMDRFAQSKRQAAALASGGASGYHPASPDPFSDSCESTMSSVHRELEVESRGGVEEAISAPHYTRVEATLVAFDSTRVVDLLDPSNRRVEMILKLAPPPSPSAFDDGSSDVGGGVTGTGGGSSHRSTKPSNQPTTDAFVLYAHPAPCENTNDGWAALDTGLDNYANCSLFQSQAGVSLLFSLTAFTDNGRSATLHLMCLAEDSLAQSWFVSSTLARSRAMPPDQGQSWAGVQNTPLPPALHHHAASMLVPTLCYGNIFVSILVCAYNSVAAAGRLHRDFSLALNGHRMRTMPHMTPVCEHTHTVPLPYPWVERFSSDGRRSFINSTTKAVTTHDPRLVLLRRHSRRREEKQQQDRSWRSSPLNANSAEESERRRRGGGGAVSSNNVSSSSSPCTGAYWGDMHPLQQGKDWSAFSELVDGSGSSSTPVAPQTSSRMRKVPQTIPLAPGDRDFLDQATLLRETTNSSSGGGALLSTSRSSGVFSSCSSSSRHHNHHHSTASGKRLDIGIVLINESQSKPQVIIPARNHAFREAARPQLPPPRPPSTSGTQSSSSPGPPASAPPASGIDGFSSPPRLPSSASFASVGSSGESINALHEQPKQQEQQPHHARHGSYLRTAMNEQVMEQLEDCEIDVDDNGTSVPESTIGLIGGGGARETAGTCLGDQSCNRTVKTPPPPSSASSPGSSIHEDPFTSSPPSCGDQHHNSGGADAGDEATQKLKKKHSKKPPVRRALSESVSSICSNASDRVVPAVGASSASAGAGGGGGNDDDDVICGSPPPPPLPNDWQDVESLVDEFAKFVKRSRQQEREIRELKLELEASRRQALHKGDGEEEVAENCRRGLSNEESLRRAITSFAAAELRDSLLAAVNDHADRLKKR